ncbi:MAG: Gfo/Idh/MocA family oxidoreductase [Verrucomicrobiae bacterium]|nr:Gfo/Idh/MocA family oxidoreductase [Verrucomicrobiae bacterium]MCB1086689.1 Gfo/Idh/MocA family oxidoreductase [Verrucomicrobiae bacterium]
MFSRREALSIASSAGIAAASSATFGQGRGTPLKYLQVGTTHAHADKIAVYRESPDWEVVGVVEPDEKRRDAIKDTKNYQGLPFLTLEQGLNIPGLKAVGIETDVKDLLRHAELAIDAGFSIHLDKPAGESLHHFRRILGKADKAGLTVQMGYMFRFNPAVQFMRECLKKGWLGEPFEVHTVMSKVVPPGPSRQGLADFPGGIMFELGGHVVDLVVGVLGRPDRVTAYPRRTVTDAGDSLVDNMLSVFEYPKATATVKSTAVEVEGGARRHFVVCGTEGTCHIQPLDRPSVKLALSQPRDSHKKGYQEIPFEPPYRRYVGDAADLAAILRGEKESEWNSEHDLAVQESLLLACGLDPAVSPSVEA